ncbi:MAG: putative selenium-dependent hydroxylase accessory protein YqeC [Chloroflexi bacterium]|nr:putative selenium-dependent hydroxylase accessory protein YqeC [Chloroflexota bacterium]
MNLLQALRMTSPTASPAFHHLENGRGGSRPGAIAIVGSGGKTTALFQLARALQSPIANSQSSIVTATSHLGVWQIPLADHHLIAEAAQDLTNLPATGLTLVTGPLDGDRTRPLAPELVELLHEICRVRAWPLLIEADGSRGHALKAPAAHEPPIPAFVETVIVVAGLTGLGSPLNSDHVHRPQVFAELSGLPQGEPVTSEALARVLTHPQGGLKNIPHTARRLALLNQADTPDLQSQGGKLARLLLPAFDSVLVGSLKAARFQTFERITGVVLAAGGSTRYGQPKQLLDWRGVPFVRAVAQTALAAGLAPVLVVTGAHAEAVESALQGLPVRIVRNQDWQEGQASSMRAAIKSLTLPAADRAERAGAAIFLLVDQPQVNTPILQALAERHRLDLPPALAPLVQDARANPVLFDRVTFPDLLGLKGDVGGRGIFHKYPPAYLPWHDDRLLLDVDTPEQYQRLREDETL